MPYYRVNHVIKTTYVLIVEADDPSAITIHSLPYPPDYEAENKTGEYHGVEDIGTEEIESIEEISSEEATAETYLTVATMQWIANGEAIGEVVL